jgi:hypothetical protein
MGEIMLLPSLQSTSMIAVDTMRSMLDGIEKRRKEEQQEISGQKPDPITQAKISASEEAKQAREKISAALFSTNKVDLNALKVELFEKLGQSLGIERTDSMSSYAYGRAIEKAVEQLSPADQTRLTKDLGLDALDVSLATVIEAIKNPYADGSAKLDKALEKHHGDGKATSADTRKVLQRLEDAADPKTLSELKLGDVTYDPTRVVDAETRKEREQDIAAQEAAEKLDDVKDMRDAVSERNEAVFRGEAVAPTDKEGAADQLLAVLAGAAESIDDETAEQEADPSDAADTEGDDSAESQKGVGTSLDTVATTDDLQTMQVMRKLEEEIGFDATGSSQALAITVDDLGIYALLRPKPGQSAGQGGSLKAAA